MKLDLPSSREASPAASLANTGSNKKKDSLHQKKPKPIPFKAQLSQEFSMESLNKETKSLDQNQSESVASIELASSGPYSTKVKKKSKGEREKAKPILVQDQEEVKAI